MNVYVGWTHEEEEEDNEPSDPSTTPYTLRTHNTTTGGHVPAGVPATPEEPGGCVADMTCDV